MGACTFARASGSNADQAESSYKGKHVVRGLVTFSDDYATGGDTLDHAEIGLNTIDQILVDPSLSATAGQSRTGVSVELGGTAQARTLLAYDVTAEVTATTDLSVEAAVPVWFVGNG